LKKLETTYAHDQDCIYNKPGTPAEGVVVRIDRLDHSNAFKLKNFRFLELETKQLDKGAVDIESVEAEVAA
jgi:hypothetical protein